MTNKVLIVDKNPSRLDFSKLFNGLQVDVVYLTDQKVKTLYKKDVTLDLNVIFNYEHVILVGADALKMFSKSTAISDATGRNVKLKTSKEFEGKEHEGLYAIVNPAMQHFKPEIKPILDSSIESILKLIAGTNVVKKPVYYKPIIDEYEALEYLDLLLQVKPHSIGLDSETTAFYPRDGHVLGISLSHETHQGVYIHADAVTDLVAIRIQNEILDNPNIDVFLHNAKFDLKFFMYHFHWNFDKAFSEQRLHCTMLLHYVLDERSGTHGLKSLTIKYTDMGNYDEALDDFKKEYCSTHKMKQEDFTYDLIPFDIIWPYAACLHKDSKVHMADGTTELIVDLVKSKSTKEVLSINTLTGKVEAKPIVGWVKNEHKSEEWYKIEYNLAKKAHQINRGVLSGPAFTPDHKVLTQRGYIQVQDLDVCTDSICSNEPSLTKDIKEIIFGCLMGDGQLTSRNGAGAGFSFSQAESRKDLVEVLAKLFNTNISKRPSVGDNKQDCFEINTAYTYELSDMYHNLKFIDSKNQKLSLLTPNITNEMGAISLAWWYFGDGNLPKDSNPRIWRRSISSSLIEQEAILTWLKALGIEAKYHDDELNNQFILILNPQVFFQLISKYATHNLAYKLPEEYHKHIGEYDYTSLSVYGDRKYFAKIKKIHRWIPPSSRRGYKTSYCISVADNNNFLTDIGFVHNCDTDATLRLAFKFKPLVDASPALRSLYYNVMLPGLQFLTKMEDRGVPIDKVRLQKCKTALYDKINVLNERLYSRPEVIEFEHKVGKRLNPGSVLQLRTLLFDIAKITPLNKFTGTGAISTDAEVLEKLGETHELPKLLLEIRKATKVLNTYIIKMLDNIDKDGCLRTGFSQHTTTSGRLSSSGKLNLQQLPRDDAMVKGCIMAPEGYKVVAVD